MFSTSLIMKRLYYCIKCINIQKVTTKSGIIVYSCTLFPKRRGIDETTLACSCYSGSLKLFVKAVGNHVKQ